MSGMPSLDLENSPLLDTVAEALSCEKAINPWQSLYLGFDLGTANLVIVAINEKGEVVSAVMEPSKSTIKDGVLVDYWGAIQGMTRCLKTLMGKLDIEDIGGVDAYAAAAYPPGIDSRTAQACASVVESLGIDCTGLYEEPTAASAALNILDGAIVDIGGGTTGISILKKGEVVYSADEPTGGDHMTLVVSGALKVTFEEAEKIKCAPSEHRRLAPVVKPVLQKMGSIVRAQLDESGHMDDFPIVLAGGGASFTGAETVMSKIVGRDIVMAPHPLLVTPTGIAVKLWKEST